MTQLIAAASPIFVVLFLMLGQKWGGSKAGPVGYLAAILVTILFFGGNFVLIGVALGRSILLALFVLYIIWMALLLYHVVNEAGAIGVIGRELPQLAKEPAAQALLISWVFGSFLQGASGFGVPAAVVAPLLVGLGFAPTKSVVIALVGHAWAITFGSLGSSFSALMAATGLSAETLAPNSAFYLMICCLLCGMGCLWAVGRWHSLRSQIVRLIILTFVMGGVQWWLAINELWNLAAFGGALVGLIVLMVDLRWGLFSFGAKPTQTNPLNTIPLLKAFAPYLILIGVIVLGQFVFRPFLNQVVVNFNFPAVSTSLGWEMAAGQGRSISIFGHAGALLFYTSVLGFGWFRLGDRFSDAYEWRVIVQKTIHGSKKTTISVFTLLAMAVTMEHAGMTDLLARAISNVGVVFPIMSPFLGALGAFMTGSNTNSNVVFGLLQQQTADTLGLSVPLILAAQTAGGAIGSVFAPAKVVVGCSTVDGTNDAEVLRAITGYGLLIVLLLGFLTWLLTL